MRITQIKTVASAIALFALFEAGCWFVNTPQADITAETSGDEIAWKALSSDAKNNRRVLDFTDSPTSWMLTDTTQILFQDEEWEGSEAALGYPSVVRNVHGLNPDNKYYLFYAQHNSPSGIGCATADVITGPYTKVSPPDSRILLPGLSSHYSSPCVLWNEDTGLWHLYFHYADGSEQSIDHGSQMMGLAVCANLSAHDWTVIRTKTTLPAPIMPTVHEIWGNISTAYSIVGRLPNGKFVAVIRGFGGDISSPDAEPLRPCELGTAVSDDGIVWTYNQDNPVVTPANGLGSVTLGYTPMWIATLGNGDHQVAWLNRLNSSVPRTANTRDFTNITDIAELGTVSLSADPCFSTWREGDTLYLFGGHTLFTFAIG